MSTKSKARGTETERMAVKFLKETWPAVERRAMRGRFDPGDVINVPFTTVEIKGDRSNRLEKWKEETLREQRNNGDPLCLLIVRRDYQPVDKWDAWMPALQLSDWIPGGIWTRMDLADAIRVLHLLQHGLSLWRSPITESSTTQTDTSR